MLDIGKTAGALPATIRERLNLKVEEIGSRPVLRATGLSEAAFWRAVAGARVHFGTCAAIERGLALLDEARDAGVQ